MPLAHIIKIEDARTAQWLRHLDPVTDPIHRIDMGWTMGDWNQLDVSIETVALRKFLSRVHSIIEVSRLTDLVGRSDWCKMDEWVEEQHARLHSIWTDADRPYSHEHGVSPRISMAKGRLTPGEAEKEHQRQKDLGWDVTGNIQ